VGGGGGRREEEEVKEEYLSVPAGACMHAIQKARYTLG